MALAFVAHDEQEEGSDRTQPVAEGPRRFDSLLHSPANDLADPPVDVLIVDDEAAIRSTVAEILSAAGYSVSTAEDGEVALELLSRRKVGMVLLDLRMPRMGGADLLRALEDPPPVVVLTAHSPEEESSGVHVASKVVMRLQKPVPPRVLLNVVSDIIGSRRDDTQP